jgi:hypothetical protein
MAKSVQQQIEAEKKRLASEKTRLEKEAKSAALTAANKKRNEANRKKIAALQAELDYIDQRLKPYIRKLASNDTLSVTEQSIFNGLSEEFDKTKEKISITAFPGATKPKSDTAPNLAVMDKPKTTTAAKPSVVAGAKPDQKPETPVQTQGGTGGGTGGGTTGKVVPSTFNVGTFRQADEASMAKVNGTTPSATAVKTPLDTLLAKTEFWYDLPDYIFKLDPKLGELLVEAVNGGWDNAKFLAKAQLTPWWQKNASTVRTRIIDRAKYDELKAAGEDVSKSDYGLYLKKQMNSVKSKAKEIAGVTLTDEQAQSVASKIYDGFLDDDPLAINALITPFIGKTTSIVGNGLKQTGFGGQALQNYQTLQGIAKANGFTLKDILPNISAVTAGGDLETAVLQGLANGDIDINRVAQDARMLAAQGQPQYVRGLLGQGYDLENIYAPYRQTMASVLEIDPNQIDLNDNTLRMAITDKGDMNLYDFKKALRQDDRWQYTGTAREEVSNAALKVLQDFGFQG